MYKEIEKLNELIFIMKYVEVIMVGVIRDVMLFLIFSVKNKFFCLFVVGGSFCCVILCGRNLLGILLIIGILKRWFGSK